MNAKDVDLILLKVRKRYGSSDDLIIERETPVLCQLANVGTTNKMNAKRANVILEKAVIVYTDEYDGETQAVLDGRAYRIESTLQMDNPIDTKLYLSGLNV